MRFSTSPSPTARPARGLCFPLIRELRWSRLAAALLAGSALAAWGQNGQPPRFGNRNYLQAAAVRTPDPLDELETEMDSTPPGQQINMEAINEARRKLLAAESAKLLELAADLRLEIEKTDKDTLSVNAMRKANEIEKLAKDVKQKMKLTPGGY
ncbi:MAG: hypothetical protein WBE76_18645 [Terracidiphilus sp.]